MHLEIFFLKQSRNGVFIPSFQICPLTAEKGQIVLLVDRPTVKKVTVEPSGRPPGRPCQVQRAMALWLVDRSVDRVWKQRAELSARSTARSTGGFPESRALWRSTDLPSKAACTFCARRSTGPADRPLLRSTDPVDRQPASPANMGLKNLSFYY